MKVTFKELRDYGKLAAYNLSAFVFGASLLKCAYGNYRESLHLHGLDYKLSVAATAVVGATAALVIGKWLINKEVK